MNSKLQTLTSGLRVITIPMPNLESATVCVWIKTGSRNEEERTNGISHFLEHMVFKGSKKRPSAKAISEAVDAIGGEFNAATSKDWTNFYIKTQITHLETAFDVLSDMVLNPLLDLKEIEREKGVIVEEIAMYEDTPMIKIGDVFEQLAFAGNSLGWDIVGTAKTVRGIKKDDFVSYRNIHYHADNIIVVVAGGVTEKRVLELVKKYFEFAHPGSGIGQNAAHPLGGPFQNGPRVKLHPQKKEQAHFILGFLGDGRGYKGRFTQGVLSAILGGGMSSRLFTEVRERRGLAYAVRTSMDRYIDTGYLGTYVGVDPKKIEEAVKVIIDQCFGLAGKKYKISDKELKKAKEYLKGHLALALEDTKDVNAFFAEQALFLKEIITPDKVYKKIDAVSTKDVLFEANRLITKENMRLAVIG
ncbi:MAG: pitrilysin family protein, partial [bacterium]